MSNKKQEGKTVTLILTYKDGEESKECKIVYNEPTFDYVAEAYKWLYDQDNNLDLVKPGKFIFDMCKVEIDPVLSTNHRLMLTVCNHFTTTYCLPLGAEIKKN